MMRNKVLKHITYDMVLSSIIIALILVLPHVVNDYIVMTIRGIDIYILDVLLLLYFLSPIGLKMLFSYLNFRRSNVCKIGLNLWILYITFNALYSIMYQGNDKNAVLGYLRIYVYYSLLFIIISNFNSPKIERFLIFTSGFLISFYAIFNLVMGKGYRDDIFTINQYIDTRRYISYVYGTILFLPFNLLLWEVIHNKTKKKHIFLFGMLTIAIIISNYRTIWLNLLMTILIWFIIYIRYTKKSLRVIKNVFVSGLLLFFSLEILINYFNYQKVYGIKLKNEGLMIAFETRKILLSSSIYIFKKFPLFGAGIGYQNPFDLFTVHNDFVQILRDTGLIGFTLFLLMIYFAFSRFLRSKSSNNIEYNFNHETLPYIVALINSCVTALFQPFFIQRIGYAYLMFLIGLINKERVNADTERRQLNQ
ncbi:O-antigen ligase family protein [Anaerocellum diazotrophicum]|uniref:O-antigen ligase-related domain-containing protein n=1 Tax=Caldicellulosiruptor diazotrophicus TaxID=2806205 RepID=A0ABM7NJU3_9FIRM|nr:O-antigen ligase family protein [Caldicellulosiruptor diazotrophicus]BCS80364.1 hypothetical protein CaldiYA01_03240 [Caldicellulosiruptor diazotrophicus]